MASGMSGGCLRPGLLPISETFTVTLLIGLIMVHPRVLFILKMSGCRTVGGEYGGMDPGRQPAIFITSGLLLTQVPMPQPSYPPSPPQKKLNHK